VSEAFIKPIAAEAFWPQLAPDRPLPCEICRAKMPPKGELFEIGGRCFLGSASILFDTAVLGAHWIWNMEYGSWNMARIWQGHIC
jgi:hypothetical protein